MVPLLTTVEAGELLEMCVTIGVKTDKLIRHTTVVFKRTRDTRKIHDCSSYNKLMADQ